MTGRGVVARLRREELGATSVVVVLLMTVLLVCAALVVDVGAMQARKAQLQDAADAAALAIAQECFEDLGTSPLGCAPAVVAGAVATAGDFAVANVNDGAAEVESVGFPTADTVRVVLASTQTGYFGRIADIDSTDLSATATARWEQDVVPLALAMASCLFPGAGEQTVLQVSLAVPGVLSAALGDACGLLAGPNVVAGTTGTVGLVAGGWLTSTSPILGVTPGECEYDPNLLTTLAATVSKVAPTRCAQVVSGWGVSPSNPQRVVVPVFDSGLNQLVSNNVLGAGTIDRYAVIDVTAYSFTGLLGLSNVPGSQSSLCASDDGVLGTALRDALGGLGALALALLGGLSAVLNGVTGCQALGGEFVGFVDSVEAARLLVGVQLVE